MLKIPAFFFPTSVVILDDDAHFSKILQITMQDSFNIKAFSNHNEVTKLINNNGVFADEIINFEPLSDSSKVKKFISSQTSEKLVSVWITDYQLNQINGIDLLRKLDPPFVQRILISGFVYEDIINEAYKQQIIHGYLPKIDTSLISSLKKTIEEMQERFFLNYCEQNYPMPKKSKLCDQIFADFMKLLIKKYAITHMISSDDLSYFNLRSKTLEINLYVSEDINFINNTENKNTIQVLHGERDYYIKYNI
jgi:hypothetical protein